MLKPVLIPIFLVFLSGAAAWGQNDLLAAYDAESIYLRTDFWRGTVFVKNGAIQPVGLAYKNLYPT